jgi:hypothetical protein
MERHGGGFGGVAVPIFDNSEKARLAYWRQYSTPIPTALLRITGWIDESPQRRVVTEIDGEIVEVPAAANPPNVLFRLPADAPSRQRWEEYLSFLRMHQSRNASVAQLLRQQETIRDELLGEVRSIWDELFERTELARDAARRALAALAVEVPTHVGAARPRTQETRSLVHQCRRLATDYRSASRRLDIAERSVRHEREQLEHTIYPGIFSEINAFLDVQCLSTASLASDEFRRRTRQERPAPADGPLEVLSLGER